LPHPIWNVLKNPIVRAPFTMAVKSGEERNREEGEMGRKGREEGEIGAKM